jgi:hypothetical protein
MIFASECVQDTYPLGSFVRYEHFLHESCRRAFIDSNRQFLRPPPLSEALVQRPLGKVRKQHLAHGRWNIRW